MRADRREYRLRAHELADILELGHDLVAIGEFDQLHPVLARLARLVGCDRATLTHLDLQTGHEVALLWPQSSAYRSWDAYARLGHTHPLRAPMASGTSLGGGPIAISQLLTMRQWLDTALHRDVMPEVTDQLSVLLARHGPAAHVVTLSCHAGIFSSRQHDVLRAAQPFLATAVARVSRAGHRALQISTPRPHWVAADTAPGLPGAAARRAAVDHLSGREMEVLGLVADGMTDLQVARCLGLAPATVSKHLRRIYARLEVPNRAAAVRRLAS